MASFPRFPAVPSGRRSFLAQVGLWGSALVGVSSMGKPTPTSGPSLSPMTAEGRIGLLMPSAANCRGLDEHLVAGFKLALDQARANGGNIQVELVQATSRLSPSAFKKSAEDLLRKDKVDLVIALAQPGLVSAMAPAFEAADRCLVAVDGGANLVRSTEQGRHIFYNTLGHWEASWALGQWAARTYRGEGFVVASPFEGGHDALRAFRLGTHATGSGEKGFHIPGTPLREVADGLTPAAYVDLIRTTHPAFVVALLGRFEGREFLNAFHQAGLTGNIPLVGSPFLAEEALAAGLGDALVGFTTASSWSAALGTPANRAFLAEYRRRTGFEADGFGALGFDTGRMLLTALQDCGGQVRLVRESLERVTWDGPGGTRTMDVNSHTTSGDVHLSRFDSSFGALKPSLVLTQAGLGNRSQEVDSLLQARRPGLVNPYPVY